MLDKIKELRRRRVEEADIHQSYQRVFETPDGQRVLRHIMRHGFVLTTTFVDKDANASLLNEGSRRLALSILRFVYRDHEALLRAIEEEAENHESII